jgi:hypothetical protein
MYLEKNEEKMLSGDYGPGIELAMKTVVKVGETFGAEKLVPIVSGHVGGTVTRRKWDAYVDVVKRLVNYHANVQVLTTENPCMYDPQRVKELGVPEVWAGPNPLDEYHRQLGIIPTRTCTPYFCGNIPRCGQHFAWEESNAVGYVNSILGGKGNRETVLGDLLSAIVGRTPYYGLHIDENRRGEILFNITNKKLNAADYHVIGYYIGKTTGTKIPVINGVPNDVSVSDLKNFSAAANAAGAVPLFHLVGITPEARSLEDAFAGEKPSDKIEIGLREINETREEMSKFDEGQKVDCVLVGCPHYSFTEIGKIAKLLEGKKVKKGVELWISSHKCAIAMAKEVGYYDLIEASGARLFNGCSMLIVSPLEKPVIVTDSGKASYYRNATFGSTEQCIKSAIEGKIMR